MINKHVVPYEILFRLNEAGEVAGCHRKDLEIVKDDETGEVFSVKEKEPQPITGAAMDAVLGVINTSLSQTCDARQATIDQLQQTVTEKDQLIGTIQQESIAKDQLIAQLQSVLAALQAAAETSGEVSESEQVD